ncbi:hypothetical protein CMP1-62 [Clavibacter phage CMP1]|uniref:Uncharacterized protein n=1 Tax=Clavibacter phage CMP1 TaxID=686439 RepID=D0U246_9CAUD|nr:hypothetical protein CMP1-62 [Clavibacter phage CMP1]ACY35970.1 hypothetical protein CMP1-62 [Clavibacter phage CMP1]
MSALPINPTDEQIDEAYNLAYEAAPASSDYLRAARRALFQAGVEAERARAATEAELRRVGA